MFQNTNHTLEPAMIETLAVAFDIACERFAQGHGGQLPNEAMRNSIAARMINCAGEGEFDVDKIIAYGLRGTAPAAA
jgi:hypothetical protein